MEDAWDSQHDAAAGRRSVYLETYGCQMNVADSEVGARGWLTLCFVRIGMLHSMCDHTLSTRSGIHTLAAVPRRSSWHSNHATPRPDHLVR